MNLLRSPPDMKTDRHNPFEPQRRIAVLTAPGIATQGISEAMGYMFPDAACMKVQPSHIRPPALENFDILVLPGIIDEDSPYPEILNPKKSEFVRQAVENGMVLMTFCAATYYMLDRIEYTKRNGEKKERSGCGLISGTARQAFAHVTRIKPGTTELDDYILAELRLKDRWNIHALNINGPEIVLADQEHRTSTPFITYAATGGTAAIEKTIGKGLILAMGIHPELTTHHPLLPAHFSPHDNERWVILDHLSDRIKRHKGWKHVAPHATPATYRNDIAYVAA